MTLFNDSNYSADIIYIYKRDGSSANPYKDITETITVNQDRVFLKEIPSKYERVITKFNNVALLEVQKKEDILNDNNYFVDYDEGVVYFKISANGKSYTFTYKGRGVILYPSSRIYTGISGGTISTLDQSIESTYQTANNANQLLATLSTKINTMTSQVESLSGLGDYAKTQGDYAKAQGAGVESAKNNAITATNNANTAIVNISSKITEANTAITNVNTAKTNADTATANANAIANSLGHKNTYSSATAYVPRNIVYYNGSSYMNIVASTNALPTDTSKWQPVALKGDTGAQGTAGASGAKGDKGDQGIQGVKGDKGDTGEQGAKGDTGGNALYTWIKYATSSTGTGMSDSPTGMTYLGIAHNKSTSTESTVASDYTWSLIKGDTGATGATGAQGTQGATGTAGATLYTWIKYGTSSAGAGISDSPTGMTYIGIATNKTTATKSNTPTDYTWSLIKGDTGATGAQGIQGVKGDTGAKGEAGVAGVKGDTGATGATLYTWIKYATSSTGTGISDSPVGMTYLGIATNKTTATKSNTASDYTWSLIKDVGITQIESRTSDPTTPVAGQIWFRSDL